ncbi:MAG: TonB family protein [Deltaproteobacteria bacterium]|nr:TonB family protein [Deltaproteobacteria bacterium]
MERRTNIRSTKKRLGKALLLLLISLQIHILVGIGVWWWQRSQREETTPRERIVELEYVPQTRKPAPRPKASIPLPARKRPIPVKEKKRPQAPAKPKLTRKTPPKPRPRTIPRPRPKAKPRLVARRFRFRRKMVDQPTRDKQPAPKHFDFWAQANRNVKKQTRARKTNLTHNDARPKHVLHGRKRRVLQAERRAPRPAPRTKPVLPRPKRPKQPRPRPMIAKQQPRPTARPKPRKPPVMMTRIPHKVPIPRPGHVQRPTTTVAGAGPLDMRLHPRHPARTVPERMRAANRIRPRRNSIQVMPTKNTIQKLFAAQWRKEALRRIRSGPKRAPSTDPSERRWKRIKAALENYIAEVTPANTTALRTRAHPFARYIAAMHRKIHPLWGDGFLVDWDMKPKEDPMNEWSRWAMVEIVLNRDGTLAKAGLVKSSGYMPFDVAALDVAFSAAPFSRPPASILSGDKKVYLRWRFHRDQRQCGTFGVDAFILTHPRSRPTTDPGHAATGGVRWNPGRSIARLKRGPALEVARPRPGTKAARQNGAAAWTARAWLAAASSRRLDALEAVTALPLRFAGRVVARTKQDLTKVYKSLLAEQSGRASGRVRILSASQLRQALGYLPKGLSSPPGALFALTNLDRNVIVLVLCRQSGRYRVCDMAR